MHTTSVYEKKYYPVTMFGKTRMCLGYIIHNTDSSSPPQVDDEYDKMLWIERGEDWYALMSRSMRDKRVLIIQREDWLCTKELSSDGST